MLRRSTAAALVLAVAACAYGCGGSTKTVTLSRGGTLTVGVPGETPGWDPYTNSWSVSGELVASAFYETLTAVGRDGKYHPYLAQSVTPSKDLRSYTIVLRPGIRFHDGTPFDARAVAYGLRQSMDATSPHGTTLGGIRRVVVLGVRRLRVDLKYPRSDFVAALASDGAAMASVKAAKRADGEYLNDHPVGTGPFRFVSWKRDSKLVVERNPDWWQRRGGPALDRVVFEPIPDPQSRFDSLRSKELDVAVLDAGRQVQQARSADLPGTTYVSSSVNAITLNVAKAPFDNPHARRAVAVALDRAAITKVDASKPAEQLFVPSSPFFVKDLDYPAYDLGAARREAQAYQQQTGKALAFTLRCVPGASFAQINQLEQAMLQKAGIAVKIRTQDFASYVQTIFSGDYEAGCWRTDPIDNPNIVFGYSLQPVRFGASGNKETGFANATNYSSASIQSMLLRSRNTSDAGVQRESYQSISRELARELPYAITDYTAVGLFHTPAVDVAATKLPDGAPSGTLGEALWIKNIDWTGFGKRR